MPRSLCAPRVVDLRRTTSVALVSPEKTVKRSWNRWKRFVRCLPPPGSRRRACRWCPAEAAGPALLSLLSCEDTGRRISSFICEISQKNNLDFIQFHVGTTGRRWWWWWGGSRHLLFASEHTNTWLEMMPPCALLGKTIIPFSDDLFNYNEFHFFIFSLFLYLYFISVQNLTYAYFNFSDSIYKEK